MPEEDSTECKSLKKVIKNGRVISYIMSPVPKLEPALPRRKKNPVLAYRHHEFLVSDGVGSTDAPDFGGVERARVILHEILLYSPPYYPLKCSVNPRVFPVTSSRIGNISIPP